MTTRIPHFVIAGTQKGGTTWLEHQLAGHPDVFTPRRQLHFFDLNFERGLDWYSDQFRKANANQIRGEKTTEYFDTLWGDKVPTRIGQATPDLKVIIILRDPVRRAMSALQYMVNSGLEPLPADPNRVLFDDRDRPHGQSLRYIERGFYAKQLKPFYEHIDPTQIMVLIFEEDIAGNPENCWAKVSDFLCITAIPPKALQEPVNHFRLSPIAVRLSRLFFSVPYARGAIRRIDKHLGLRPWQPVFDGATIARLAELYEPHNFELFSMLGREIPSWSASAKHSG